MAKENKARVQKGNSSDTLLAIYVLRVLKKYSSPGTALTVQEVLKHLQEDHSIGIDENGEAQKKKIRRYLDTLCESYGKGCIGKQEGARKDGYKWYYDASKDEFASEEGQVYETLSNEEIEFIIDIIASSKILNSAGTIGIVEKLLSKTNLSIDERRRKLGKIKAEKWSKSINKELIRLYDDINVCIDESRRIRFDYDGKFVLATPYGWDSQDGKYVLVAKVSGQGIGEFSTFLLEKICNFSKRDSDYDFDDTYFDRNDQKPDNESSLESLFANVRKIHSAIKKNCGVEFEYLSYVIKNGNVALDKTKKRILPHSLVFNDGKYYLIGIDQDATDINKVGYFRVDLIADLDYSETKITLSEWNKQVYETIQRAREVEKHPMMVPGQDISVDFLVLESALDRVRDAYGLSPRFQLTKETKVSLTDLPIQKWNENHSVAEVSREKLVKFTVRTTREEAYRWALANADAVELVYPPDLRHKLRRISDPIQETYAMTMADRVQENVDRIFDSGFFKISRRLDKEVACETFKVLDEKRNTDVVREIHVSNLDVDQENYLGRFTDAEWLTIRVSPSKELLWAKHLVNLVHIELFKTFVENVSWLEGMKKLKYVQLTESPVRDLSILRNHENIMSLEIRNTNICDISFIENYRHLHKLDISGCPIEDYSVLLRIPALYILKIDEKAVAALGMDNLVKHHPDAVIEVQQKIDNRKV